MTKTTIAILLLGAGLGSLATTAAAGREALNGAGPLKSHELVEEYEMSLGLNAGGRKLTETPVVEEREELHVPDFYGSLFQITSAGDNAVLWYLGEDGVVRNAIVNDVTSKLVQLRKEPTRRRKTSAPR